MEIRDPLYGLVQYGDLEEKIINSQVFQRLRGIKQLALAFLVYPGAHHTRFEHSIGVMHLCGRVGKILDINEGQIRILRLTGLLHDIGHGPFSHVLEQIMDKYVDRSVLEAYRAESVHELITMRLIKENDELRGIISLEDQEQIITLLQKNERSVVKDIISGPMDVDKFDYLQRDSYFAGVKYGSFDLDKIIDSLIKIEISSKENELGINEDGIHSIEQLLLAKYHMNIQVYKHRIRRITDAMLVKGVEYAINENIKEVNDLVKFKDSVDYLNKYVKYKDYHLIELIIHESEDLAKEYLERISQRKLFKQIFKIEINQENFNDSILLRNVLKASNEQLSNIAYEVSHIIDVPQDFIIIDKQTNSNPTFKNYSVDINMQGIMVKNSKSQKKFLSDVSEIFQNPSIDPTRQLLYIYAPLDKISVQSERQTFILRKHDEILNAIGDVLNEC